MNGTVCPICGGESHVLRSRVDAQGNYVRRRECDDCEYRWNSTEIYSETLPLAKRTA